MSNFLFSARTTNGNSTAFQPANRRIGSSNNYTVIVYGTFGGATIKLQASADNTTYVDIPTASWTAATVVNIEINAPYIRANLSGATGPTSLSVWIG